MPLPSHDFSAVLGELTISTSVPPRPTVGATVFRRRAGATHGWKTPGTEPHGGKRRLHCLQWLIRNGGRHSEPRGSIRSRRFGPSSRTWQPGWPGVHVPRNPRAPPRMSEVCIHISDARRGEAEAHSPPRVACGRSIGSSFCHDRRGRRVHPSSESNPKPTIDVAALERCPRIDRPSAVGCPG